MKLTLTSNPAAFRLRTVFMFSLLCVVVQLQASVRYVKPVASGSGDGSSWADASANLQAMINASGAGDEVWVAAGTYKPTTTTDRTISFVMKNGVAIYGGFNGTETQLSERNWVTNVTTLSGDIGTVGDNSDNSYHVVFNNNNGLNSTAVLDGFTITGGRTTNNFGDFGGGMSNKSSSPTVSNCIFSGNTSLAGGGMSNDSSSPTVSGCTFSGNSATNGGGMFNNNSSSPTVSNCTFSGNSGGGMSNVSYSSPTVSNCTFSGNTSGGGMANNTYSSPMVSDCTFSGNSATTGGGMYNVSHSSPTVSDCMFSNNSATTGGGGMSNNNSSSPTVSNCTFSNNSANNGSGMYNNNSSSPMVSNCTFSDNPANSAGGGMYNDSSFPMVSSCTFSGNSADNGGGMYNNDSSSPTVSDCTFSDNSATTGGGGMFNNDDSSPTVSDCIFSENPAGSGGGLYNDASSPTVSNCTFSGNSATGGGGMLNNNSSSPTVSDCAFSGNSADSGSGMLNNNSSSPTVSNCTFSDNLAIGGGGGMFNASSPTVSNCSFSGNSATSGGGMFNASSLTLTNCTFFGNSATTGGGIFNATFPLSVTNCILWGNQATNSGNQIHNLGSTINISYTILEGGIAAIGNTGTVNDNGNNSTADPLFIDAANGNLRLQACSPAINTGSNAAVPSGITTDLDGNPRFYNNGTVDMGAYEFQGTPNLCLCTNLRTWTGALSTDWNTAGNWNPACVPTANDDVTIPDMANDPVIGTAALAKSVHLQPNASLTINAAHSLTINGFATHSGNTTGFYNEGTVTNSGALTIGSSSSVGQHGIWNAATFNNSGGQILIDNATGAGMSLTAGTFSNQGMVSIGALAAIENLLTGAGTFSNGTGGTLKGGGNIASNFTNAGGTLAPGASPGKQTFLANTDFGASTYECEINGIGQGTSYDWIAVNGTAAISSSTSYLSLIFGAAIVSGTSFDILTATSVTGTYNLANVSFTNTGAGNVTDLSLSYPGGNTVRVTVLSPLPVELFNFTGKQVENSVLLEWRTASERNNEGFQVQRSTEGRHWKDLAFIPGHGSTTEAQSYSFADTRPLPGGNYYRLQQVDFDGQFEYSHIVSVEMEQQGSGLLLFPNPATGAVTLVLEAGFSGEAILTLYDLSGKQMKTQTLSHAGDAFQTMVDLSGLPGGVYLLEVRGGRERWRERVVVIQSE